MLLPLTPEQLVARDVLLGTMLGSCPTLLQPAVIVVVWPTTIFAGNALIQPVGVGVGVGVAVGLGVAVAVGSGHSQVNVEGLKSQFGLGFGG